MTKTKRSSYCPGAIGTSSISDAISSVGPRYTALEKTHSEIILHSSHFCNHLQFVALNLWTWWMSADDCVVRAIGAWRVYQTGCCAPHSGVSIRAV